MNQKLSKSRWITRTAILLALCIASQFFKNLSVYITGPIINCILIIAVLSCGIVSGIIISVITPITSFIITGSPIMAAMPLIMPCVMLGNIVICLGVYLFCRKEAADKNQILGMLVGTIAKAAVMGLTISVGVIGIFGPSCGLPEAALNVARTTFSLTQLITAAIGSVLAFLVWKMIDKVVK